VKYEELEKIIKEKMEKRRIGDPIKFVYKEILNLLKETFQKKRIDCMTCKHLDRWSDSCPFCQYEYDKNTDSEQRADAGVIEN